MQGVEPKRDAQAKNLAEEERASRQQSTTTNRSMQPLSQQPRLAA